MKNRKLNVDELQVETFATAAPAVWNEGMDLDDDATLVCSEKRSCGHVCP